MTRHHFISYAPSDRQAFAIRLCDALAAGPPAYAVWLDQRQLRPGSAWDDQIVEAIRTAESLLFVMTQDSVNSRSKAIACYEQALKNDRERQDRQGESVWLDNLGNCYAELG
jgi:tetratricopeptide (TPR) repeat protein